MNNKTEHDLLPFVYDGHDECDFLACHYYNVVFTETFGAFEKGEKAETVYVSFKKGVIVSVLECGTIHKIQHFYPEPVL